MLSGPPDTAIPNRSTSAGRSISLSVSFLNRERRDSSSAFGTGAPLGHDILQPTRSRRAVHVVKFIINLACIAWLFELDQCLPQIRQAIGCTFALGPFLVIFVKGHRSKRRLPFVQISATEQVLRKTGEEHTSELQSLIRISYAVFCLKKKKHTT